MLSIKRRNESVERIDWVNSMCHVTMTLLCNSPVTVLSEIVLFTIGHLLQWKCLVKLEYFLIKDQTTWVIGHVLAVKLAVKLLIMYSTFFQIKS